MLNLRVIFTYTHIYVYTCLCTHTCTYIIEHKCPISQGSNTINKCLLLPHLCSLWSFQASGTGQVSL